MGCSTAMAHPLRLEYPGALYHLAFRGDGRESIYLDDEDRDGFLSVLASAVARYIVLNTVQAGMH